MILCLHSYLDIDHLQCVSTTPTIYISACYLPHSITKFPGESSVPSTTTSFYPFSNRLLLDTWIMNVLHPCDFAIALGGPDSLDVYSEI